MTRIRKIGTIKFSFPQLLLKIIKKLQMDSLQETLELMCYTARMSVGHVQVLHSTSYHGVPRPGETSEEVRKKSEKLTFLHGGF